MDELIAHIFVRHPDRKQTQCWSCSGRKEDHQFVLNYPSLEETMKRTRKKGNARSVRTKSSRVRAVR